MENVFLCGSICLILGVASSFVSFLRLRRKVVYSYLREQYTLVKRIATFLFFILTLYAFASSIYVMPCSYELDIVFEEPKNFFVLGLFLGTILVKNYKNGKEREENLPFFSCFYMQKNYYLFHLFILKILMNQNLKVGLLILSLLVVDQFTKRGFYDLKWGQELFFLYPTLNTGISRGIAIYLPLVILISFLGIGLFIVLWKRKKLSDFVFILFLSGTIGNLADRVLLDGVRDFISIGRFPVFNLADCFLTLAVILLCRNEIFPLQLQKKKLSSSKV